MKNIIPNLWFDSEAEEAARFYVSLFKDGKITNTSYYKTDTPSNKPIDSVLTVSLELNGQSFVFLNGGPFFKFSEAVSFIIECEDQEEVDYYWEKLSAVPESEQCGWLKDKYGVSWQVIPARLYEIMQHPDEEKAKKGMDAMLQMKKINISELEKAIK